MNDKKKPTGNGAFPGVAMDSFNEVANLRKAMLKQKPPANGNRARSEASSDSQKDKPADKNK
ncbi:hypothetical protein [Oceanimonas smirnovii]|uniref:hypothetical protein n=1 Tax=Oceanimonas smirnovii TaxID=264574 RepID=UPI003FD696A7